MPESEPQRYALAELARQSGIPPRTIRFYIARGLVPGPDKAGRDAGYGAPHLERLQQIRNLQNQGCTLSAINAQLAGAGKTAAAREPLLWRHYPIAEDVVMMIREDAAPWRVREIRKTIDRLQQQLTRQTTKEQPP